MLSMEVARGVCPMRGAQLELAQAGVQVLPNPFATLREGGVHPAS